jgi:hypothetical protein
MSITSVRDGLATAIMRIIASTEEEPTSYTFTMQSVGFAREPQEQDKDESLPRAWVWPQQGERADVTEVYGGVMVAREPFQISVLRRVSPGDTRDLQEVCDETLVNVLKALKADEWLGGAANEYGVDITGWEREFSTAEKKVLLHVYLTVGVTFTV